MFLVPLALDALEREPLVEATFCPGDLLGSVLRVPCEFWHRHADLRSRLDAVIAELSDIQGPVADEIELYRATAAPGAK